jgi:hypothetical protein
MDLTEGGEGDGMKNSSSNGPTPAKASSSVESNGSYHQGGISDSSDSESFQRPQSRPSTASGGGIGKLLEGFGDEIGEDVRMVVTLLANSGSIHENFVFEIQIH